MYRVYAFLDESGEYAFHEKSGRYLVYTGVVTASPTLFSHEFAALKYDLMTQGNCLERFHAAKDKQAVRDRVFGIIGESREFAVHSIIVRKNKVNPSLYKFGVYSLAYRTMLRYLVGGGKIDQVHIIVDTVPDNGQQGILKQTMRLKAEEAMGKIPFSIDHHNSSAHALLQAADYCAWAIQKKWQSDDIRSYDIIKSQIRNEYDLFKSGDDEYY